VEEERQIRQQLQGPTWRRNTQVMWSGTARELAQQWADKRAMQTLTTAMGPLMVPGHRSRLKPKKSKD
jgi:hypothetical protein